MHTILLFNCSCIRSYHDEFHPYLYVDVISKQTRYIGYESNFYLVLNEIYPIEHNILNENHLVTNELVSYV